MEEGLEE
jgi:hypothetical protein